MFTVKNKGVKRSCEQMEKPIAANNVIPPKKPDIQDTLALILVELNKLNQSNSDADTLELIDFSPKDDGLNLPKPDEAGFSRLRFEPETEKEAILNERLRQVTYNSMLHLSDFRKNALVIFISQGQLARLNLKKTNYY